MDCLDHVSICGTSFCVFLKVLESDISSLAIIITRFITITILFKMMKKVKHFTFLNTAVKNRNIGIAVAFSVLGVVAGAVAMWFYMKRKSGKPKPQSMFKS